MEPETAILRADEPPPMLFDYSQLEMESRIRVQTLADTIRRLMRVTAQQIVEIGEHLTEVRQRLGDNRFENWLDAEFGWKLRTAYNFMAVAEKFTAASLSDGRLSASALYLLAAPGVPEEARTAAVEIAQSGGTVSREVARAVVRATKKRETAAVEEAQPALPAPVIEQPAADTTFEDIAEPPVTIDETAASEPVPDQTPQGKAWLANRITVTLQLLPTEVVTSRQCLISVQAGDLTPIIKLVPASQIGFTGPVEEMTSRLYDELPGRLAKAEASKPAAPAKPATKTATKKAKK